MRNSIFSLLAAASLVTPALAGQRVGLVQSQGDYSVQRNGEALQIPKKALMDAQVGDTITADGDYVSVQTPAGQSLIISSRSNVAFPAANVIELRQGSAALATDTKGPAVLTHGDLTISPVNAEAPHIFMANAVEEGVVRVEVLGGAVNVTSSGPQGAVAMATAGDRLLLTKVGEGWVVRSLDAGQPGEDVDNNDDAGGGGEIEDTGQLTPEDDDVIVGGGPRLRGAALIGLLALGGAAAAGGAGYAIYEATNDDDDDGGDDSDDFQPAGTTILPSIPGQPGGPGNGGNGDPFNGSDPLNGAN